MTGPVQHVEPGAIVFLPEDTTGFTDDEIYSQFSSSGNLVTMDEVYAQPGNIVAAADVQNGAMVALVPAGDHLSDITLDGGEPEDQLHLTLIYLGQAADLDEQTRQDILDGVEHIAANQPIVEADAFAPALFNPDGEEPCVVLICGGESLADVQTSVQTVLDEFGVEYPPPRIPWIPHITLAYFNGSEWDQTFPAQDLADRTGLIRFDRIRVAFGGEVKDFPLDENLLASADWPFHLAGQHNQHTHGRGGATPAESAAAVKLNKGKQLDESNPEEARIGHAIHAWASGGNDGAALQGEFHAAVGDPGADTPGASLMRTIAAAPADAPKLHRGMAHVAPNDIPREGDVFELGPTSFTRSEKVMHGFSQPTGDPSFGYQTQVHMTLRKGSRSLKIDHLTQLDGAKSGIDLHAEQEHITMGKFRVAKHKVSSQQVATPKGKRTVERHEIEIEQVPDTMETTIHTNKHVVESDEWWGN